MTTSKTPNWQYAIAPIVALAVIIVVPLVAKAIIPHVPLWDYIVSLALLVFGVSVTIFQLQTGASTTKLPYVLIYGSMVLFLIWAYTSQPAV